MKRISSILLAIIAATITTSAGADALFDTAHVVSATPVFQDTVTQRCQQVQVQADAAGAATGDRSMSGSILGGVAGALLGSQVGGGNGNKAAIAAGAITGAVVGDRVQNDGSQLQTGTRMETRCDNVSVPRMIGYDVRYEYAGQIGTIRLPRDPGTTLRVAITPAP